MTVQRTTPAMPSRGIAGLIFATVAAFALTAAAGRPSDPYARVPAVGASVRFDGSVGGEKEAWAYADQNSLEAFLQLSIDAALSSAKYDENNTKMNAVFVRSLTLDNGTLGQVQRVQRFSYRGHNDVELQVRVKSGSLNHALVWTTPTELVDSSGHKYLK